MSKQSILAIPRILTLSTIATLIAASVGTTIAMIVSGPLSLLALLIFPIFLTGLVLAAVLAAPVTFGLFPLTHRLLKGRPILTLVLMPTVGFFGGGAVIFAWISIGMLPHGEISQEIFSGIGMISGLIAGAFYGRGLYA